MANSIERKKGDDRRADIQLADRRVNDVCQLGTADETPEIVFHKVLRMNLNAITNPTLPHEAARKLYADGNARKVLNGYIYVHKGLVTRVYR